MFEIWMTWFALWMLAGAWLRLSAFHEIKRRKMLSCSYITAIMSWTLFSSLAAEITRLSLIAHSPSFGLCAAAIIGLMLLGAVTGLITACCIDLQWSLSQSDIVAGIVGACLAGWIEITLSYNPMCYVLPIAVVGAVFGTAATRIAIEKHRVLFTSDSEKV